MNQEQWDASVKRAPTGSFLQSWYWGQMHQVLDVPFWRLHDDTFQAVVVQRPLPLGYSWLYVPGGPFLKQGKDSFSAFEAAAKKIAHQQRSVFIRIDPRWSSWPFPQPSGWRKAPLEVQPQRTIILDVTPSEETLLSQMHPKVRYNIRLAQRKGVTIRFSKNVDDLQHFFAIARDVSSRSPFRYHPHAYYEAMVKTLGSANMLDIALAEYNGRVITAHILIRFNTTMTYAHGASSNTDRNVMAPHLLHWESIKRAKALKLTQYDFYGVAPKGYTAEHPWAGITRLKEGFGGQREEYIGAYDCIVRSLPYAGYAVLKKFRH